MQVAVANFIAELRATGFENLPGRNKPSWVVPPDMNVSQADLDHAKSNNLHHYHIGFPKYEPSHDGLVSRVILHYQLLHDEEGPYVVVVGSDSHPPFKLPEARRLEV